MNKDAEQGTLKVSVEDAVRSRTRGVIVTPTNHMSYGSYWRGRLKPAVALSVLNDDLTLTLKQIANILERNWDSLSMSNTERGIA